jgi:aspartyl/asparaginyl beta-hydroxylase (cupin superfamily)
MADQRSATDVGVLALQRGDPRAARGQFETALRGNPRDAQAWLYLAHSCQISGDLPAAEAAADRLLALERGNLYALLIRGEIRLAAGDERAASSYLTSALQSAMAVQDIPPDLRARLRSADDAVVAIQAKFRAHLDRQLADAAVDPAEQPGRFREALDILSGTATVQLQQPTSFFYPGLPHTSFFSTEGLDWVAALESAAPAMRAEVEAVLAQDHGFEPYIVAEPNRPNRDHALRDDIRWSALHLWQNGAIVPANAARCPRTMDLLAAAPMPAIAGRSPMALFSQLRPRTHIPPHHGMLNTRLICHIPLIVPDGCRLRVGNETRAVRPGEAMLFDDSIEHEAWNDSDDVRVVLLFEVWRPELTPQERAGLTALFEAPGSYGAAG